MKLSIFKVLQMLAKSEFLGHVSLSEGLVFWSLQKSSLKSRCGECRSCWEVASHYVGSVLQKRAWSPAGNCHHIFSVIKDQNTNNSCFTSAGMLAQTCEAMSSVETSPRVGQPSVVGWHLEGSHHVTREAWLCIKDCSWPTLGVCSLPCSWEAPLEAAWRELLCTATLRHACTSRLRSCHCCSTGRDLLLRGSGLLTALCSVTFGCFRDAWLGAQGFLPAWQSPTWCWGSCHHGSSTGCCCCCSKTCKVLQEVSDGEAARQHLHLPGAAPQVGILLSTEVHIFFIEQKREILSVFHLECRNMKKNMRRIAPLSIFRCILKLFSFSLSTSHTPCCTINTFTVIPKYSRVGNLYAFPLYYAFSLNVHGGWRSEPGVWADGSAVWPSASFKCFYRAAVRLNPSDSKVLLFKQNCREFSQQRLRDAIAKLASSWLLEVFGSVHTREYLLLAHVKFPVSNGTRELQLSERGGSIRREDLIIIRRNLHQSAWNFYTVIPGALWSSAPVPISREQEQRGRMC